MSRAPRPLAVRGTVAVVLTTLVLLAGCQAPATDQITPTTATESPDGKLDLRYNPPYNASAVLDRVERLRGLNATARIVVAEYPRPPNRSVVLPNRYLGIGPVGALTLGVASNDTAIQGEPLGYTVRSNGVIRVWLMSRGGLETLGMSQELVLAHELTHALQYQHDLIANNRDTLRPKFETWTTDTRLTAVALIEGDAMATMVEYRDRYAPAAEYSPIAVSNASRANWPAVLSVAPYQAGLAYFKQIGMRPETRTDALQQPPESTRHLLWPDATAREGSVDDAPFQVGSFDRTGTDTVGPLALRQLMTINNLSTDRSTAVTADWLAGQMAYYEDDGRSVVRWTTRWRNASAAAEFLTAYRDQFASRSPTRVAGYFVVPPTETTPRTVARIEQQGDTVVITAGESRAVVAAFLESFSANTTRTNHSKARL